MCDEPEDRSDIGYDSSSDKAPQFSEGHTFYRFAHWSSSDYFKLDVLRRPARGASEGPGQGKLKKDAKRIENV